MTTNTVLDHLYQQSEQRPERVLYTFVDDAGRDQEALTCRQLAHAANGIAAALIHQHGFKRGDRVLLSYPQSLDFIKTLLGCMVAGIIPVPVYPPNPLNPGRSVALFGALATQCQARGVLTNGEYNRLRRFSNVTGLVKGMLQKGNKPDWPQLPWIRTDQMPANSEPAVRLDPAIVPQDVALLQFTSGSTSVPKGVAITYENIEYQLAAVAQALHMDAESRGVLWIPQYHDLGLINGIFNAIFVGGHLTLMSPLTFLKRPDLWFEVMSRVRATHTAAPNFAYDLAVRKTTPEQRRAWDLSSLQVMMLAAEPVQPTTIERFFAAFTESGIPRSCCCPGYGLAEHTVGIAVYGKEIADFDRHALEREKIARPITARETQDATATIRLVGCGRPLDGVRVRIVDPDTHVHCPEHHIGEIWADSTSKAVGYEGMPEQTAATFHAQIVGEDDPTEYLRTGDLGFFYNDELFVIGRIKDLIIIRGRNIYPQDIEETIRECHPLIRPGGVVAFSVPVIYDSPNQENASQDESSQDESSQEYEQVVIMAEVRDGRPSDGECQAIVETIQQLVVRDHQLNSHTVMIVQKGALLKTTSGKIQRQACRQAFLEERFTAKTFYRQDAATATLLPQEIQKQTTDVGTLATGIKSTGAKTTDTKLDETQLPAQLVSLHQQLRNKTQAEREAALVTYLQTQTAQVIGLTSATQVEAHQKILALGLDSLKSIELAHRIETELQVSLPLVALIDSTIGQLATTLATEIGADAVDSERMQPVLVPQGQPNGTVAVPASHAQVARRVHGTNGINGTNGTNGTHKQTSVQTDTHKPTSAIAGTSLPPLLSAPAQRHQPFPLTDLQHAFWIGQSGEFDLSAGYHGYLEIDCTELDVPQLTRSWQQMIARHEMLRAVVLPMGQQQILATVPAYQISSLDLRGQEEAAQQGHLHAIRAELSHQRFALSEWPLFDIRVTHITDRRARLHISLAGIMLDGASLFHLLHEWEKLYQAPTTTLPPLHISYRDYVLWLESLRQTALYQRARDYWLQRIDSLPPAPALPLKPQAETMQAPQFVRRTHRLAASQWQRLQEKAQGANVTPSVILLTAFAKVLATWSTEAKFTLNLTFFNRPPIDPQINEIVGDFTTINLLEVDHSTPLPFVQQAQQLHHQLWTDLAHRAFSGIEVIRAMSRTQATKDQRPLMPVVFTSMLPLPNDPSTMTSTDLFGGKVVDSISQTPQVYLDHQVTEENGTLLLNWDAVDDLFPTGLLDAMFDAYCNFLHRLATDETTWSTTVHELVPATQLARRAQLNATAAPIPDELVHTRFLQQAAERGQELAVLSPSRSLTYSELLSRANSVSNWLYAQCHDYDDPRASSPVVAIVMEKGWEQIVGVLGSVLAGAAYLPIDPDTPRERLWYLLRDGGVTAILTQSSVDQRLVWPEDVERLAVDTMKPAAASANSPTVSAAEREPFGREARAASSSRPEGTRSGYATVAKSPSASPDDLVAIIYTSGSTGTPKGVMISHRGLVNAITATNQRFAVGTDDRVLALTPLIHDMSMYDIFGTLAAGGTIVMPEATHKLDATHWLELIEQFQVTIWNSVPAMLEMLLNAATGKDRDSSPFGGGREGASDTDSHNNRNRIATLRLAFLGGDWIGLPLPTRLQAIAGPIQVVSVGGPTETTLWNIWYPIDEVDPTWPSIPYGKPIANTRYYILNDALEACPNWVPGQLYVAGVGLSAGYWRDAEKTAATFIHHPVTGERLYATGDLGRYHAAVENGTGFQAGNIEFLGRKDNQLKVRGRRIEPGEIEATLQHHPLVSQAVVTAAGEENHKRLVAHVVRNGNGNGTAAAGHKLFEAVDFSRVDGIRIYNPIERIDFKLSQHGLRRAASHEAEQGISLARPVLDEELRQRYLARQSYRHFSTDAIPFAQFSRFISCLMQTSLDQLPLPKYRYPSGGGLYPVQCYLSIRTNRIDGVDGGFYYYHPSDHRLVPINTEAESLATIHSPTNQQIYAQSAFSLYLIADMEAIAPMYGQLSHELCLLEAGYMGQLLMSEAPEHDLGLCPIGALDIAELQDVLGLGTSHHFLHSLVGGRIEPAQRTQWLVAPPSMGALPWQETLRNYLKEQLPAYMVPSTFTALPALPLTANGKVDRRALSRLDPAMASTKAYVAPRTPLERDVAAIWSDILNQPQVGVYDDFFELGGDSLSITRLLTKLRTTFEIEFPLRSLFDHPTVATFADYVETIDHAQAMLPAGEAGAEEEEGTI